MMLDHQEVYFSVLRVQDMDHFLSSSLLLTVFLTAWAVLSAIPFVLRYLGLDFICLN